MTKKYRLLTWIFGIFTFLCNVGPLAVYAIQGLCTADLIVEKVSLTCTIFVVVLLSVIAWVNKTTMRSRVWVVMLGLYFSLDHFITPLIIIAVTQILDEWIINPLYKYFKNKYRINKEIDKRL